jgi:predicted enzyme related to lactoylglutathione lyase
MASARGCWIAVTLASAVLILAVSRTSWGETKKAEHGGFTGDVKLVFYVSDVRKAVPLFTEAMGFTFHRFYDHVSGKSVDKWTRDVPPIYAEMSYTGRRFGLHAPTSEADKRSVGAAKVYFRFKDLEAHHRRASASGAHSSKIQRRPWMDMFHVVDPDGNRIYFAYTDPATHGNPWTDD